ncbi:glycosyltransferase family 2 protein [Roseomonas oryzicola]|uniref:Glycosyltransferase family 2 protein n=1 Tax=Neoroseomonas oryzicola TaxID=535904 RepID=A0A9X9WID0_9PROT|nr:glycosyltransferase family 2 protein [Neoroseomonas oryzicola]MBR0660090.1 glycosyltransferase family 2 protein [Neoroseomonas oryzicola]NKE18189.1 glycosyltransferase family 2 protein [Neoroseomonas oryzicola]
MPPLALAIVIPAYQEGATIAGLIARMRAVVPEVPPLVVDDGSTDATAREALMAGAEVLALPANQGKGAALRQGMRAALAGGAGYVATLDGDGQHRPEDLPRLLALARPDRIVIGSRRRATGQPAARRRANRVADFWISWAAGHAVADSQSGFRIYPAAALTALDRYEGRARRFSFESEILIDAARAGITTVAADIPALYAGTLKRPSHFRPVADISRIVMMVAGKLLARGMDPAGLRRALAGLRRLEEEGRNDVSP